MNVHVATPPLAAGSDVEDFDFEAFLARQSRQDVLRFITCGSVDDGKSTLIGRLLHDTKQLFDDQLTALTRDSRRHGTQGGGLDFALLLDGLSAEREQGITIDVAYRFFATERRAFIVADTPGHEQYTRNMATGASTADLAVLLVDAGKGITRQTRRHSLIVAMLGIRQVVLAVNKMDLVGWSQDRFEAITAEYEAFAANLGFGQIVAIPLSALNGDNVVYPAVAAPWYQGPTLVAHLERAPTPDPERSAFAMPVQWVNRPDRRFRGYAGLITGGTVTVGQRVRILPGETETTVERIVTADGDLPAAVAGQSVTLTLADAVDVSRGDVIADAAAPPHVAQRISARVFQIAGTPLRVGALFYFKLATATAVARVAAVARRLDPDTGDIEAVEALGSGDIGDITLELDRALAFRPYAQDRDLGGFILIDRENAETAAIGLIAQSIAGLGFDLLQSPSRVKTLRGHDV